MNNKVNVKINNAKIKERFGFDLNDIKIINKSTTTRNNEMFAIFRTLIKDNIKDIKVISENDKYRICFYSSKEKIVSNLISWCSVGTKIMDIAWLDETYKDFLHYGSDSKKFIDHILNYGKINVETALRNYLLLNEGKLVESNLIDYWKSINQNDFKEDIWGKLYFAIYLNIKNVSSISNPDVDNRIKTKERIQKLQAFLNPITQVEFVEVKKIKSEKKSDLNKKRKLSFTRTIEEIVNDIRCGNIEVPIFQRDYIWKPKNVISLLNSLIDEIPIGSILMAETNISFGNKNKIIKSLTTNKNQEGTKIWLLMDNKD